MCPHTNSFNPFQVENWQLLSMSMPSSYYNVAWAYSHARVDVVRIGHIGHIYMCPSCVAYADERVCPPSQTKIDMHRRIQREVDRLSVRACVSQDMSQRKPIGPVQTRTAEMQTATRTMPRWMAAQQASTRISGRAASKCGRGPGRLG